jgi:hypothetical protein
MLLSRDPNKLPKGTHLEGGAVILNGKAIVEELEWKS